jgi:tetratricopeptide (TPR) repeat protein
MILAAGGFVAWQEAAGRQRRVALASLVFAGGLAYLPLEQTAPDRVVHYVNIANSLLNDPGRWDQAADYYARALKESPRSPAAHYGIGALLDRMNKPKDALVHYTAAVEGWPDNADLRIHFAMALVETGSLQEALDQLDAAVALRPGDPTPHVVAGELLLAESRSSEAAERYGLAIKADPRLAAAQNGLGEALLAAGDLTGALHAFERALQLDSNDRAIRDNIERVRQALGGQAQQRGHAAAPSQ